MYVRARARARLPICLVGSVAVGHSQKKSKAIESEIPRLSFSSGVCDSALWDMSVPPRSAATQGLKS